MKARGSLQTVGQVLALTLFCLALYVPGLTVVPPLDRDEARFAQATKQMLETGDLVDIRFQEEPRHKKPAGIHWLQAASVALVGEPKTTIWPYRLPSALAAWAAALLVFAVGASLFDRRTAWLGAGLTAGSVMLVLEAHQAKTDAVLLATVVAAQLALARLYMSGRADAADVKPPGIAAALTFWNAQAVGILVKGPIAPLVSGLTILALVLADRDGRWLKGLRPKLGVPLALAIVAPWAIAIGVVTDGAFYTSAIGSDLLSKVGSGQESHGAWPGYHMLLMLALFWPGSLYGWPALLQAWRTRAAPGVRFCLAWLVPAWLVFELVPTKLPHYVLPLYPALALLTAHAVLGTAGRLDARWVRAIQVVWAALAIALGVAAMVLPAILGDGFTAWSLVPAAAAFAAAVLTLRLTWRGRPLAATLCALLLGAVTLASTLHWVMPRLSDLWLSREIAALVAEAAPAGDPVVAVAGLSEPSLVFLLGTRTRLTDGAGAARHLAASPGVVVVVSAREADAFRSTAADLGVVPCLRGAVTGLNYSKGDDLQLTLYDRSC
ncbi:MAG: glycosyltransferase family 39 protein [Rhodospirillales bacterium]|nr:glycosyltransferase family 39 protein [Rhodospirillales bacterium]